MTAQTLRSYFEGPQEQRHALNAYFKAWGGPFSLGKQMLDHYDASQRAFDAQLSADEAFEHFKTIFDELKGRNWQVFRPYSPDRDCWPAERIFDTIKREFREFSWGGPVNLLSFAKSGARSSLKSCLVTMRGIKPTRGYPHMTVSKFLHFYNPGLFPIYDNKVIWEKVFTRFRDDFRDFCGSTNIPYDRAISDDSEDFLLYYIEWASSLLSSAHPTFMQVFARWLGEQSDADLETRRFKVNSLYATAFEITAIGATEARRVDGLTYERDLREEPDSARQGAFKKGWNRAVGPNVDGGDESGSEECSPETLAERLTWWNLGYRLGRIFGETSAAQVEEMYQWCTKQYRAGKSKRPR